MAFEIDSKRMRGQGNMLRHILLVVFLIVSIAFTTMFAREGDAGFLHTLQSATHAAMKPFSLFVSNVDSAVEGAGAVVSEATVSDETLQQLRQRNAELTRMVTQGEEYRLEAERLRSLLGLKDVYGIEGVSGRVVGRSTDAWNQTITIDIGSSSGVENGLTVMGGNGVVGQVVSTTPGSATVRLLTDPQSGAAAILQASRAEGVVRGSLSGQLYLENVDASVPVYVGDVVLTSGLGGSYVKGLLIGTVVRVEGNASDGSRKIVVAPNNPGTAFEEVTVVFNATGIPDGTEGESKSEDESDNEPDVAGASDNAASNANSNVSSSSYTNTNNGNVAVSR